jgi:hypothetical protein
MRKFLIWLIFISFLYSCSDQHPVRQDISLNEGWYSIANDTNKLAYNGFESPVYSTENWEEVNVPHNWDDYGGYRRLRHGNRHGYAWYRKSFQLEEQNSKRYFLWFEGVGSYATVWLNGDSIGYHAGGRTSFTLDVTDHIRFDKENILAVRADHPSDIRDLPWVCGGCSPEWGFSEGSQPMGIFRPVHLIVTNPIRIEPFGVHIWNDDKITTELADLHLTTEVKNNKKQVAKVEVINKLFDERGRLIKEVATFIHLSPGQVDTVRQHIDRVVNPHLWSIEDPYLYKVITEVLQDGELVDQLETPYGIRWTKWDIKGDNPTNRFYLNGKPVFINGTAEYEHMMGQGHAFSDEQVLSRVAQVKAAGYNAFRDGHQPHNIRYQQQWDSLGILWWPQMSAHIWFGNTEFQANFKQLLHDWIKERRNCPSIILWGLQNECTMPTEFARECTELIRELDPGASSQRLVTTCNGGTGTDWNVIQNWSGTYGGNPDIYDEELSEQLLNGEYGAWRSIDLHTEGDFEYKGPLSEDRFWQLMESKVRLGEAASDQSCGQFHWLLTSHDNPGRTQAGEGLRDIDRVGPVNYKGALTIWGEPLDVFYMFRSNYAPRETDPMVYIVSHTWPNRWEKPGIKDGIRVFSNCDEVELFNGVRKNSLGRKKQGPIGTHFKWDQVDIQNNVLYAVGYVDGKEVAEDHIVLGLLPEAADIKELAGEVKPLTDNGGKNYLYRVNCGGPDYLDQEGNIWQADVRKDESGWGSVSWTDDYDDLPAFYGSQRITYDPIQGTDEWKLIQTFRYGRHKLAYKFPIPDGDYQLEMYFLEPWYGTGGGLDCNDWRIFDVAVNDEVVIDDLDIWEEVGHDNLLKKTVAVSVKGGELEISFPEVKAAQAVISAIAISTADESVKPAESSSRLFKNLQVASENNSTWSAKSWMNNGDLLYSDADAKIISLPPSLFGSEWVQTTAFPEIISGNSIGTFELNEESDLIIGIDESITDKPKWIEEFTKRKDILRSTYNSGTNYEIYQKRYAKGESVELLPLNSSNSPMYVVAAVPVTNLDAPIDLRPSFKYEAEEAGDVGNTRNTEILKKDCKLVPGKGDAIEWTFNVGLASKYGLEFRYMNKGTEDITVDGEIVAADGRMVWSGEWVFPVADIKWKSLRTDTQTTINAGKYTLRLKPRKQGPFYFDWMKIQ